jgi:gliding motility-associated-like protein
MRKKLHLYLFFVYCFTPSLHGQIVGKDAFLQGKYIELAMNDCGAFGTAGRRAPLNYHPNAFNGALGFVADPQKNGWNTGNPDRCGDYFLAGLEYEGWYLQVGNKIYENGDGCSSSNKNPFTNGRVFNHTSGQTISAEWEGSSDSIYVHKRVYFHRDALYFVVDVEIENQRKTKLKDVFYMRTVDADNEAIKTNDNQTINTIVNQPTFGDSRALVSAVGKQFGCYLGLGTKDCRAKVSTGIIPNRSPKNAWNGLPTRRRMSGSETSDSEICISFKLQDIQPGEKATLSYAYVLEESLLDSGLSAVEPRLLSEGIDISKSLETVACLNSPITLEILNEGSYDWTWSPNIEIDTTAGRKVVITPSQERTYQVKGFACDTVEVEFLVKVRLDTATPTVSCPKDTVVYLPVDSCSVKVDYSQPTFWDDCTGEKIERNGQASGSFFGLGVHTISYKITDRSLKSANCEFKINVLDSIKPKAKCKDLIFYQQRGSCLTLVNYPLDFASDNCPNLNYQLTSGLGAKGAFPVGTTQEGYTIKDQSGNSVSCSFKVTVLDTLPPVILHPNQLIARAGSPFFYQVRAFDECDSSIQVIQIEGLPSGSVYDTAGLYLQRFTAIDRYGNRAESSFWVVVNTPPSIQDQTFTISENSAVGSVLGQIAASDADGNDISFRVRAGNLENAFRVNIVNGILTVNNQKPIDYEKNPVFKLRVEVMDDGPGSLKDTATVTILVLDENEPPTQISLSNFSIPENQPLKTLIGKLFTSDPDSFDIYENYSFIESSVFPDNLAFSLENDSLLSAINFNYEAQQEYLIKVGSKEKIKSDFISDTFRIFILNINDLPTVSSFAKTTNSNISIRFTQSDFNKDYADEDGDEFNSVVISQLPLHGTLSLSGQPVAQGDSIFPVMLEELIYQPNPSYSGQDVFYWQASDNRSFSLRTEVFIKINPPLVAQAGEEQKICLGKVAELGSTPTALGGTPPYRYTWRPRVELDFDDVPNPKAAPFRSTQYIINVVDSLGARASDTVLVEVSDFPKVKILQTDWKIVDGQEIKISIFSLETNLSVLWQPTDGVAEPNSLVSLVSPKLDDPTIPKTIDYQINISNPKGCDTVLNIRVEILPHVNIPTGFSPNGDGINDTWILRGIEAYPENRVEIYDRYGQKVFGTKNYSRQNAWDGSFNGKMLPFGSYFFVVELGTLGLRHTGHVTILD